jgi:hypothetical protein
MRILLRSALVLTFAGTTLLAHYDEETPGWEPVLLLRGVSSTPEGAQSNVSGSRNLVKEPIALIITSGSTLCSLGIASTEMPPGPSAPNNVWKLNGEYLGEKSGRHQIRVTTGFTRLGGQPSTATTTQTLSLREGDNVTLDVMTAPPSGNCQVRNVTIDARLVMQASDPALARARYSADLWLVHTDPNGQERREHLITNVDGSAATPFVFSRLSFPLPFLDARQGNAEAFIQLSGALRARTHADGLVDLDVDTNRIIFGADRPDQSSSFTPTPTRKTLTLKVDETTAIEFPPPSSGYSNMALDKSSGGGTGRIGIGAAAGGFGVTGQPATAAGVPVQVSGDRLVVNTSAFFKGHRTQMLVTLRRVR